MHLKVLCRTNFKLWCALHWNKTTRRWRRISLRLIPLKAESFSGKIGRKEQVSLEPKDHWQNNLVFWCSAVLAQHVLTVLLPLNFVCLIAVCWTPWQMCSSIQMLVRYFTINLTSNWFWFCCHDIKLHSNTCVKLLHSNAEGAQHDLK